MLIFAVSAGSRYVLSFFLFCFSSRKEFMQCRSLIIKLIVDNVLNACGAMEWPWDQKEKKKIPRFTTGDLFSLYWIALHHNIKENMHFFIDNCLLMESAGAGVLQLSHYFARIKGNNEVNASSSILRFTVTHYCYPLEIPNFKFNQLSDGWQTS